MPAKRWFWCLLFIFSLIPQNALSIEQPTILEETLQLNRWGSGKAVLSFEADSDCGELSIEANGSQRRVWMLYIRLNGRHLVLRFPGGKTRLILNRQVDLKSDNRMRIVILGRPRATFSIRVQPCPPSPPPPTAEMTASSVSIHHPNDCRDGLVAGDQCASTLTWETTDADTCQILPDVGAVDCVGSIDVAPDASTTYTLTAAGDGGTVETSSEVSVVRFPQAEISIKDSEILQGERTALEWATRYADTVEIQPEIGIVGDRGSVIVQPEASKTYTLTATGPGGAISKQVAVSVSQPHLAPTATLVADSAMISQGDTATLSWTTINGEAVYLDNGMGKVPTDGSVVVSPGHTTIYTLTVTGPHGVASATATVKVLGNPEDPPRGSFGENYADLIPPDATIDRYDPKRFALINGEVFDEDAQPIEGVSITIHSHPEYGTVTTDDAGRFIIPAEGGGTLIVAFSKPGLLPVQRKVQVPWSDFAIVDTVRMTPVDELSTDIILDGNPNTLFTHRSTVVDDRFGERAATVVISGDNRAYAVDEAGEEALELTHFTVRATEYATADAMPAQLPPRSAYTYCVELAVDGVRQVRFERPLIAWVENFIGFDVGMPVPLGAYDSSKGVWVPYPDGIVVTLLDTDNDGTVDSVDATGDGGPDDIDQDGSIVDEALGLEDSGVYKPGTTYWRAEIPHFSPWDMNWPYGAPPSAVKPDPQKPIVDQQRPPQEDCLNQTGSYTEARSRIFHEDIPIPGTDMLLHYASNRVAGYQEVIRIPATGSGVPEDVKEILVEMTVAGRLFQQALEPLPDQEVVFVWDRRDGLGREVTRTTTATIKVGYVYDAYYYRPWYRSSRSFDEAGDSVTPLYARKQVVVYNVKRVEIELHNRKDTIAAGWTLSHHHTIDPLNPKLLFKGDGTIQETLPGIETIAGTGSWDHSGDGGPAIEASFGEVSAMAFGPDGSLYIADKYNNRVRKIDPDGIITTVAGNGSDNVTGGGNLGDGRTAAAATLPHPLSISVDREGNLYIVQQGKQLGGIHFYNNSIRKVGPDDVIKKVAGDKTCFGPDPGDGGSADDACFARLTVGRIDADNNLYLLDQDNNSIRKVDPSGRITTVAGAPYFIDGDQVYHGYFRGDGGPAVAATLFWPLDFRVQSNGDLIVADTQNERIRKVDRSGTITTIAGDGRPGSNLEDVEGKNALEVTIKPGNLDIDPDGNIYFHDTMRDELLKLGSDGKLSKILGRVQTDPGRTGVLPRYADLAVGSFTISPKGEIYFYDRNNNTIRAVMGSDAAKEPSGLTHTFSGAGLHETTFDQQTGKTLYHFVYDDDQLISVNDRFGNQTRVLRDAQGVPTAIVSPGGVITRLTINAHNALEAITYPTGATYEFEYDEGGLLTTKADPNGNRFEHTYGETGRLLETTDENGGSWEYRQTELPDGAVRTEIRTAEGNRTEFWDRTDTMGYFLSQITSPDRLLTVFQKGVDKSSTLVSSPNGMASTRYEDVDPEYRYPYITKAVDITPSGLKREIVRRNAYSDTNHDGVIDKISHELDKNGTVSRVTQDLLASERVITSAEGRTLISRYDPETLLTERIQIPGLYDTSYQYDGRGRLVSMVTGNRSTQYAYTDQGFLSEMTGSDGQTVSLDHDLVGRVTSVHRPDGSMVHFAYDPAGNLNTLTTPSGIHHRFGYNKVHLNSRYTAPSSGAYRYRYDRDRRLIQVIFPSGKDISYHYEGTQLAQVQAAGKTIDYQHQCCGQLSEVSEGTNSIEYDWDGSLLEAQRMIGLVNEQISYSYDNDFRLETMQYTGGGEMSIYDDDGLLTTRGAFNIDRNDGNGLPENVSDGTYAEVRQYSGYGELNDKRVSVAGQPAFEWTIARDDAGRITRKIENIGGRSDDYRYAYDAMGRLKQVMQNGTIVESYDYDPRGVRISETNQHKNVSTKPYSYSDEDHLLTAGDTQYTYNLDGFLTSKSQGSQATTYEYGMGGELLEVQMPDGRLISYDHDPMGRRIAKRIDGVIVEKYLWEGLTRLLAVYDGNDNRIMRFRYADSRMPVAMTYAGDSYYLLYDQVGSLRMVVDETGTVVKQIDYDSFGYVTQDSAPSLLIPFGFAGGLYDTDTQLVRFGHRDYDPEIGRWTAKDPIFFAGGNTDLFGYVKNNPGNLVDPLGLIPPGWWGKNKPDIPPWKERHYNRNQYNQKVGYSEAKEKWKQLTPAQSAYHRMGPGNENNQKFVSQDGHSEAVFYPDGTTVIDPANMATYNFSSPDNWAGHFGDDILPYWLWGNSADDPATFWERLTGTYDGEEQPCQ